MRLARFVSASISIGSENCIPALCPSDHVIQPLTAKSLQRTGGVAVEASEIPKLRAVLAALTALQPALQSGQASRTTATSFDRSMLVIMFVLPKPPRSIVNFRPKRTALEWPTTCIEPKV
jgi:hypothetical protein